MKQVSFEKALKYNDNDIIVVSNKLKSFVKFHRQKDTVICRQCNFKLLEQIANEIPMPMYKLNSIIHEFIDDITYIEMMSRAKFFMVK